MEKLEYKYRISEDSESPHESGYDYRVEIEARKRESGGEWWCVDSFHTLADYAGAVDEAEAQIEWLSSRKVFIVD